MDPDPGSGVFWTLDPGSGMEKIRIRDKHKGSATLGRSCHYVFQFKYFVLFLLLSFYTDRMSHLFQAFVSVIPRRKGAEEKEDSDT